MDMLETLELYGFDLTTLTPGALVELRAIYAAKVSTLKGEADKADQVTGGWIAALTAAVADRADLVETVTDFKSAVREIFFPLIDQDHDVLIPLIEALQELKQDVTNERDYWVQRIKRGAESPTEARPADDDFNAEVDVAKDLAEAIRLSWQMIGGSITSGKAFTDRETKVLDTDLRDAFAREFPTEAKVVGGVKTGEKLPDLPRLPNKRTESGSGRNSGQRFTRYLWRPVDGTPVEIPAGTLIADVAHDYVSNLKLGVMVSGPELTKLTKDFGSASWSLTFPTGILTGTDIREASTTVNPDRAESPTGVVLPESSPESSPEDSTE